MGNFPVYCMGFAGAGVPEYLTRRGIIRVPVTEASGLYATPAGATFVGAPVHLKSYF